VVTELRCPECHDVQVFEQPPCAEDHNGDCPEWVCTFCGTAVFAGVAWSPSALAAGRSGRSSGARKHSTSRKHAA
jgi:hypothetical protein